MVAKNLILGGGELIVVCKGCGTTQKRGKVTNWNFTNGYGLAKFEDATAKVSIAPSLSQWPTPDTTWRSPAVLCEACSPVTPPLPPPRCARCKKVGKAPFCAECDAFRTESATPVEVEIVCLECGSYWEMCECLPLAYDAYKIYF